jgi:hypothetical protein
MKIELVSNYLATPISQHPHSLLNHFDVILKSWASRTTRIEKYFFPLNTHFSVASPQSYHLPSTITSTQTHSTDHSSCETFSFRNVDEFEVKNVILRVKFTAIGLGGISFKFIKLHRKKYISCTGKMEDS